MSKKSATEIKEIKTASVLAFERKISNSDAIMLAGKWADIDKPDRWQPILIQEKSIKGTISNRQKTKTESDPLKLNQDIQKANLQRIDYACLPFDADTLKVEFSLRVLNNVSLPCACNDPNYQIALQSKIQEYIDKNEFKELALRYAENIANGRFLWRNRLGAEKIIVNVKHLNLNQEEIYKYGFESNNYNLKCFETDPNANHIALAEAINNGLKNDTYTGFKIEAFVKLGEGQEVFPSQELVLNDNKKDGDKNKFLYSVNGIAAMHSQKIGNALRTIDTWYGISDDPISVESYGSVTNRGIAYRQPREGMDFYSLFDSWITKNINIPIEQQHFVVATLIKGGVFGATSEGK